MEGWIKLHRQLQDNKFWTCEPFTRGQAWVDLILLANHKYGFFYKRGNKVEVKRGQVGVSEKGLSVRWQWSRTKVRKFLKDLEKEQQIVQQKSNVTQVLTVINYDKYQEKEPQKDTKRTPKEPQKDTNKNDKEEKKNEKKEKYKGFSFFDDKFSSVWNDYLSMRKEIKKPATNKAEILALNKVMEYSKGNKSDAIKIVNNSILNSWQGIFDIKKENTNTPKFQS